MTVRPQRALLAAFSLAVALVAAIFASAPTDAQDAQDLSVNPIQRHQRANADGTALEGFYYKAADSAFLHHLRIHFVPSRYGAVGPATYRDFGRLELFFESTGRTNLHPGTAVRSDWWFTADGTALAACSDDSHRCRISKTEYQALAGQTGTGDDAVIGPIVIGFKIPSSITDDEIVLQSKHDTSSATRPSSNQWQNSRWTRVDKPPRHRRRAHRRRRGHPRVRVQQRGRQPRREPRACQDLRRRQPHPRLRVRHLRTMGHREQRRHPSPDQRRDQRIDEELGGRPSCERVLQGGRDHCARLQLQHQQ